MYISKLTTTKGKFLFAALLILVSSGCVLIYTTRKTSDETVPITQTSASADEYDTVLITRAQKQKILDEINKDGSKSSKAMVLNSLKAPPAHDYQWHRALIDNSVHSFLTGDDESRQKALAIMRSHITGGEPYEFKSGVRPWGQGRPFDHAVYCNSMALSYDLLRPHLSASEDHAYRTFLKRWGAGLNGWMSLASGNDPAKTNASDYLVSGLNWNGGLSACLGNIALELQDEPESAEWLTTAKTSISGMFELGFNPAGDYTEGHGYQGYGTGQALMFAYALKNTTGEDILKDTGASNIWNFFTYGNMSDNRFPVYGDNSYDKNIYGEYLYTIAEELNSDDEKVRNSAKYHLWMWQQVRGADLAKNKPEWFALFDKIGYLLWYPTDIDTHAPLQAQIPTLEYFPSVGTVEQPIPDNIYPGGMYVLRNGWEPSGSVSLWLVNRWRSQVHQHYDPNSYTLSAYGASLVTDNEYEIGYRDDNRGRLSNKNAVLIDNWFDRGVGSSVSSSSLGVTKNLLSTGLADIVESDAKYPYNHFMNRQGKSTKNGLLQPSIDEVVPIEKALKTVIMPKSFFPGVIMLDEIDPGDGQKHMFKWLLHYPAFAASVGSNSEGFTHIGYKVKNSAGANVDMNVDILFPQDTKATAKKNYSGEKHSDRLFVVAPEHGQKQVSFLSVLTPGLEYLGYDMFEVSVDEEQPAGGYSWTYKVKKSSDEQVSHVVVWYNPTQKERTYASSLGGLQSITTDAKLMIWENFDDFAFNKYILVDATKLVIQREQDSSQIVIFKSPSRITATVIPEKGVPTGIYRPKIEGSSPIPVYIQVLKELQTDGTAVSGEQTINFFPYIRQNVAGATPPANPSPPHKPPPTSKPVKGDFTKDGKLRMDDLALLINGVQDRNEAFDLNKDGYTNVLDVNDWLALYSQAHRGG